MPRFHFNVHTGVDAADVEGIELHDLDAAKARAVASVRYLASDDLRERGVLTLSHSIEIADPNGRMLHLTHYRGRIRINE